MTTSPPGAANPPVIDAMARFARSATWSSLPESVRRESGRAWLNWVACAVGGARTATMDAAVRGVTAIQPVGEIGILGRPERVGLSDAALLQALSSSAHTYDDTHLSTITHPTGPVASALLATAARLSAEGRPVAGETMLTALIVGMELECRTSCAIAQGGGRLGWYMTGLTGGIGAAAAVSKLLGLSLEETISAIALATAQACGTRATHGSMAIAYIPAIASRNGLVSAHMAAAGFTCSAIAIEGRNGLLEVTSDAGKAGLITDGLGRRFEMMSNAYKPYPCGIVIHPAIDACLHIANDGKVPPDAIAEVHLRVHPDALNLTWRKLPTNELDAQVSLFHWAAASLVHGAAGVEQGLIACIEDPAVRAVQERMTATADDAQENNQAVVSVKLTDGRVIDRATVNAIGSQTNPMTDAQLDAKFRSLAAPVLGQAEADAALALCRDLHLSRDVADVLAHGSAPATRGGP